MQERLKRLHILRTESVLSFAKIPLKIGYLPLAQNLAIDFLQIDSVIRQVKKDVCGIDRLNGEFVSISKT
jgi:hypothetical protein